MTVHPIYIDLCTAGPITLWPVLQRLLTTAAVDPSACFPFSRLLNVGHGRTPCTNEAIAAGADQPSAILVPCDINHSATVT